MRLVRKAHRASKNCLTMWRYTAARDAEHVPPDLDVRVESRR